MPYQSAEVIDPTAATQRNKLLAAIVEGLKGLGIQLGARSTTATAGAASLPSAPAGFVTVVFADGTAGKLAYYAL